MAMSAEQFAALHRQWLRLHLSEKFSSGNKNSKQTNKTETNDNEYPSIHQSRIKKSVLSGNVTIYL